MNILITYERLCYMPSLEQDSIALLTDAVNRKASDIHFHPRENGTAVLFRIQGDLHFRTHISRRRAERLIAHFKFISGMDIGEQRRPQNGALFYSQLSPPHHLRFSTLPTPYKESLVIRLLPQDNSLSLSELSLFPQPITLLKKLIHHPYGLLIFTGPTGSGKTTTLYSLLHELYEKKQPTILTIEDPIEKRTDKFLQIGVNPKSGITYAEGLRSSLRHDPDIIMIGEIRDEETAAAAIRAALTGHLVVSTLHSRDKVGALFRLQDLGINKLDLKETLLGVVSQRLVRKQCTFCQGNCSIYCPQYIRGGRTALFDILANEELEGALEMLPKINNKHIRNKLPGYLLKGIALGYLPMNSWKDGGDQGIETEEMERKR
ncbi:competence type IV pilus ATPase ComGA [Thalassorhabdus alkalitolerans]|uniref:Competence type IV pilus ATPase ComGA n=2 Tax=Thalassorhabdus alkalitolerans TaxID=2282697 RepID=A0ABW0YLN4_9BACI